MQVDILTQMYLKALKKKNHMAECGLRLSNGADVWVSLHIDKMPDKKDEGDV